MTFSNKFIFFLLNIIVLIKIKESYIVLPFSKKIKELDFENNELFSENFVNFFIEPIYSSIIEIGNPPQKVELIFSSDYFGMTMIEDKNSSTNYFFNKKLSSTLNRTYTFDSNFNYYYGENKPITLTDSIFFSLYDNKLKTISTIKINEYPFIYLTKNQTTDNYDNIELNKDLNGKAYMIFGTKLDCNWKNEICEIFPYYFKHNSFINNNIFNIIYNQRDKNKKENYDFKLLIGNEAHLIDSNEDNLKYTKALSYAGEINWMIDFKEVFYFPEGFKLNKKKSIKDYNEISFDTKLNDKKLYTNNERGQMAFDMDIILCSKFYYFSINKTYFGNHTDQCKINHLNKYAVFICDKNFDTTNFPSIYFYNKEFNYTFVLEQNELFKIVGDKKIFLIIYDLYRPQFWLFGKIFLEKYSFNYDMESKQIGFYKNTTNSIRNEPKKYNILLINLLWLGIAIIFGILSFFIGKKLFNKIRKKRANELDDYYDYDYQINSDENINHKDNEGQDNNNAYNENNNNKLID